MPSQLDLSRFEALTFDCYGTLIDWESGLLSAYRRALGEAADDVPDEGLLEAHARHEMQLQAGPYRPYRQVLALTLAAVAHELGCTPPGVPATAEFAGSVGAWPAFPDSSPALSSLARHFRLGVITNCDDDLFEQSRRRLGVDFEWVITAQAARSYKPAQRNFELAFEHVGLPRRRILHVAQSLYHDHVPARQLGLASVWIDRRHHRPGFGATPPASAVPDLVLPDLASLAALANGGQAAKGRMSEPSAGRRERARP